MNLKILTIFIYLFLLSCSNKTIYSGKIFDQETFDNLDFNNKETLLKQMGNPSFIDPIENKYFYYSCNSVFHHWDINYYSHWRR